MRAIVAVIVLLALGCGAAKVGPQWTEQDAVRVVKREFQVSTSGCREYDQVAQLECYLRDPVLGGVNPALAVIANT